ncbi:MAG: DUF3500 domain-containing protein [Planctomycetota bacterium]
MAHSLALAGLAVLAAAASLAGPEPKPLPAVGGPSLVSRVLASYAPEPAAAEADTPAGHAAARVAAVDALRERLSDERRAELCLALDDPERANWTNVPPGRDEEGLRLGDCDEAQLHAVCNLLATVLSEDGYARSRDILLGDDLLLRDGRPRPGFGAENYWLVLFGEPAVGGEWGLQLDGHHLALNLSFKGEGMTMSPTFLGAQPSRFERGDAVAEPLAGAVAAAFAFVASLTDEQRGDAVVGERRGGNVAAAGRDGFVPERDGLALSGIDEAQRAKVMALVDGVLVDLPVVAASARRKSLEDEVLKMHFSWRGPTAPGSDVSFRLQGPTLILEYACQDLGGDPLDHLHLMYRDPTNEYGAGL